MRKRRRRVTTELSASFAFAFASALLCHTTFVVSQTITAAKMELSLISNVE